jgi:heme/copper-type cytochrome/quinol oxidase subunit 3
MSTAPVADAPAPPAAAPTGRLGMWVFLVTDASSFGALLLSYAILRARAGSWPDAAARLNLPLAAVAAALLVASSWTLVRGWIAPTLALGALFLGAQIFEYAALARHGIGIGADPAASIFFVATGWHGLHVLAGLIALAAARRSPGAALFWQFVDALWVVLFTAFYLGPAVGTAAAVALGVAAACGFFAIVFFAMNLRRERRAVKLMFVLPLAFPVLFVVALVADALARGIRP